MSKRNKAKSSIYISFMGFCTIPKNATYHFLQWRTCHGNAGIWFLPVLWPQWALFSELVVPLHRHQGNGFSGILSPVPPAANWWKLFCVSSSYCWRHCCHIYHQVHPVPPSPASLSPETSWDCCNCPRDCSALHEEAVLPL